MENDKQKDQMILLTSNPGGGKLNMRFSFLKLILNKNIITCPGITSNSILPVSNLFTLFIASGCNSSKNPACSIWFVLIVIEKFLLSFGSELMQMYPYPLDSMSFLAIQLCVWAPIFVFYLLYLIAWV
jgi:hypothetical protein